jgi:hypothetical protein
LSGDQLATMARHPPGSPGAAVAIVAHASLLRHTDAARDQVQAIAQNHAADALTVVSAAEKAYRAVGEHARRLSGTTPSPITAALNPTNPPSGQSPRWSTPPPTRPPDEPLRRTR